MGKNVIRQTVEKERTVTEHPGQSGVLDLGDESLGDEPLIALACNGDAEAFAALIERHYSLIYRIAYKWCGNQADAEDIAQEVCIKLGQNIGSYKANAAFSSWLYRVTLNTVHDHHRAHQRQTDKVNAMACVASLESPFDLETRLADRQIWHMVRELPDKQRDAVLLIYAEDLSHKEAAAIMDCAESTISWHIHEAKKTLRRLLER